jgi:predicted glutamine amidotransferase
MCLAVAVRKNSVRNIKREDMLEAFDTNNDGAGFAWHTGGKVKFQKGFFKFEEFWEAFDRVRNENPEAPFLIHFRMRTHGARSPENTHPFKFKGGVMIHNGWFSGLGDDKESDTAHLARLMHDMPLRSIPHFLASFGKTATSHNKIAILDNSGNLHIMNETAGHWREGVWFSNSSYQKWNNHGTGYLGRGAWGED